MTVGKMEVIKIWSNDLHLEVSKDFLNQHKECTLENMWEDSEVAFSHDLGTSRRAAHRMNNNVLKYHWQNDSLHVYLTLASLLVNLLFFWWIVKELYRFHVQNKSGRTKNCYCFDFSDYLEKLLWNV